MPARVPFGRYVEADSPVHRLDARAKLGITAAFVTALFALELGAWPGLAAIAVATLLCILLARVPIGLAARGVAPITWILVFTVCVNALLPTSRSHAIFSWGALWIDAAGLERGAYFAIRIVLLVLATSVVTLTTSPVALTDALAQLMRPGRWLGLPVDDAAMMMAIALRFIPTTAEEADRIVLAQTARGARFSEGGLIARVKAWIPVLIPLFVRLFRRADDLALAMESRCYRGSGRTHLREARMGTTDWTALIVGIGLAVAVGMLR